MRKIKIAPSIMCADLLNLERDVRRLEKGGARLFHFDIMDGTFVPNIALGAGIVKAVRASTRHPLDTHLMIIHPEKYIRQFADAGSDIISIHAEATVHLDRALQAIKDAGARPAVALNPSTPLNSIRHVLDKTEVVLVMAVNPGFAGQAFIPGTVRKVADLRKMLQENGAERVEIEVDGCVNDKTIAMFLEAGANIFVGGTAGIFTKEGTDITASLSRLYANARSSLKDILRKGGAGSRKWWTQKN